MPGRLIGRPTKKVAMNNIMQFEQNNLNNNWLCWVPCTPEAYYFKSKKEAASFCNTVNTWYESKKEGQIALGDTVAALYCHEGSYVTVYFNEQYNNGMLFHHHDSKPEDWEELMMAIHSSKTTPS